MIWESENNRCARDRTMYKDTVYDYYEGFTKGLTVHCIFKQALKHKWMIHSNIKWIVEELDDQDCAQPKITRNDTICIKTCRF